MIDTNNIPSVFLTRVPLTAEPAHVTFLSPSECYQQAPNMALNMAVRSVTPSSLDSNSSNSRDESVLFQPGEYDVVCGRGKGFYNRPGNKRFRELVYQHMEEYQNTRNKLDKSVVLNRIMERVKQQNNGSARFIKNDKKRGGWFVIADDQAREKVGHAMREAIAAKKESSEQRKSTPAADAIRNKNAELVAKHQTNLLAQQKQLFAKLLAMSESAEASAADSATVVSV